MADFDDGWTFETADEDHSFPHQYGLAFTWAVWVTTATGFKDYGKNELEVYFTIVCTMGGVLMYAFIIGSASSALNDMDTQTSWKRKRLQQMADFLHQRIYGHVI